MGLDHALLCFVCFVLNILCDMCGDLCDAPKPGSPLTPHQPAEYKWMSGYPTPL